MKQLFFDFFHSSLNAQLYNPKFESILESLIGALECDNVVSDRPITNFSIRESENHFLPMGHQKFYTGDFEGHGEFEFARGSTGWSMRQPNILSANFCDGHKECALEVSPNCPEEKIAMASAFAIDYAVGLGGQCMIHGACLDVPNGSGRILIHAKSGTGKTTIALALALSGYKICSDDASVIGNNPSMPSSVWGLPRSPRIDFHTKSVLSKLEPLVEAGAQNHKGKFSLSREKMGAHGLIADLTPAPILVVIGLNRDSDTSCNWRRLEKYDGLMSLVSDNIHFGPHGFFPGHERRLDRYSAMLASAVPVELNIGNNINEAIDAINQIVQECVN